MSLLHSLMTILQFCNGFLSPTSPLGSTISRNLINCFRVQKSALDVLAALSEKKGEFIFLIRNNFTVLCLCVFQQGFGCSISQYWSFGFVFSVSECDTLIGNLFDVLLAYLQSPNTSPTVSIKQGRDPGLSV